VTEPVLGTIVNCALTNASGGLTVAWSRLMKGVGPLVWPVTVTEPDVVWERAVAVVVVCGATDAFCLET
jgi:hypothetical protein